MTLLAVVALVVSVNAAGITPTLVADTAPNAYGSPNYGPWWSQAKADVTAGTFINMRSGAHPGTPYFEPVEEIVYSTGDLGKRLHWIYWVPNKTISELQQCNFQVNWMVDWEGKNYVYDWNAYDLVEADLDVNGVPTNGWIQPSRWEEYNGGVVGTFGFAWWAYDDLADPLSTDANPYNETDDADIEELAQQIRQYQTHVTGYIRWNCGSGWEYQTLRLQVVPEPGTIMLWLSGLAAPAFAVMRRRK